MTTAAHTPGPWHVEPLQWDYGASIAIVATGQIIATISPENEDEEPNIHTAKRGPHDEANALLIAAAPDLLKAAIHSFAVCEAEAENRGDNDTDDYPGGAAGPVAEMLRTAIAKAQGGGI